MKKDIRFVGIDDSKKHLDIAIAEDGRGGEVRVVARIANERSALKRMLSRLGRKHELRVVYEAGPNGFSLYREVVALGHACMVAAPSKTPRKAGDRIKNDRRDAEQLARLHRAGELTAVWVPGEGLEGMRDLVRAREAVKHTHTRACARVQQFLQRHGRRYEGRSSWTRRHWCWLDAQKFGEASTQYAFEELRAMVFEASERLRRFDEEIARQCAEWRMEPLVRALMAHRGVSLVVACTLVAEIGDFSRFRNPRELMAFVGLVPSLHASGEQRRNGRITRMGNAHARRVLVEGAWSYRYAAGMTRRMREKTAGQPPEIQQLSWKCQQRLCGRFRRLKNRGKSEKKIVVAIARELVAFLWSTAQLVDLAGSDQGQGSRAN